MPVTFEAPDGRTLSYTRRGAGPLVICVPGGPGFDPEAYLAPLELPGFELLILAPRGTGASTAPPSDDGYRIAGYAGDLELLRRHLGRERLTLYGHSHGGSVALAYALAAPERVARMVLSATPAGMSPADAPVTAETERRFAAAAPDGAERLAAAKAAGEAIARAATEQKRHRLLRTMFSMYVVRDTGAEAAYLDRVCAAAMNWHAVPVMFAEMRGGLDLLDGAGAITAPTLAIAGELDVIVPPAKVRRIAEAIPGATYAEFPGTGHFPEVEATEAFTTRVCDFLAD
jgi:pimeloyl-ACP methyl ester carboxylesterase